MNANHVLVFQDANVAGRYDEVFEKSWQILSNNKPPNKAAAAAFSNTNLATEPYSSQAGFVLCVQPVSATPLAVYRLAFGSPRSFADVD